MMIETVHEMGADYLKISEAKFQEKGSILQMLRHNEIRGILPPIPRMVDGKISYYYEISGLYMLEQYLKSNRFGKKELIKVFRKICEVYDSAREYLIEDYELLQMPDSLFIASDGEVYMPFLPLERGAEPFEMGTVKLVEVIMTYMDHSDRELIFFVYDMYKRCKEETIRPHNLKKIVSEAGATTYNTEIPSYVRAKEEVNQDCPVSFEGEEGTISPLQSIKKEWIWMGGFLVVGAVLTWIVLHSDLLRYEISGGYNGIKVMVFFVSVLLSEGYAASKLFHREGGEKEGLRAEQKKWEDEEQTVLLRTEMEKKLVTLVAMEEPWRDMVIHPFPFRIGKEKGRVDGFIEREGVSRLHGEFICEESKILYRDMDSTNGTYLNNEELIPHQPCQVHDGDVLQFGLAAFKVTVRMP